MLPVSGSPFGVLRLAGSRAPALVRSIPVPGMPSAPGGTSGGASGGPQGGAIEVAASPDGRFAFVTLEDSQQAAVFNPGAAVSRGFGPADYVGSIPLELAPVGVTVSPDGRWLYATSEVASRGTGTGAPGGASSAGTLTVIDLLLVSNFDSGQVEAVDVATVPGAPGPPASRRRRPYRPVSCSDSSRSWRRAARS
jgi:DNA-binding beta-propeller fold protein YncE